MKGIRVQARIIRLLALFLLSFTTICHASRISGVYVSHGPRFAEMLQLTETNNGQLNGVFSFVQVQPEGNIISDQKPVTGAVDTGQLTLNIGSFLSRTTIAGTISGNAIHLQTTDSGGNVTSSVFQSSTPDAFKHYADDLKAEGARLALSLKLERGAHELRETAQTAEGWISNAELHAQRIPKVKDRYEQIEKQMQLLVARERITLDSLTRGQISVAVSQGDIAGNQADIEVDQVWDINIADGGANLHRTLTQWDGNCSTSELKKRGATSQSIQAWQDACEQMLAQRTKFETAFKRIMDERTILKSFQVAAQQHRQALVNESNRIE